MKGINDYITADGVRVLRIHYTADPDKDIMTTKGRDWLAKSLVGYPGGLIGAKWRREMEIDFNAQGGQLVFPHMERHKGRIELPIWKAVPEDWKLYGGFDYAGRGVTAFIVIAHDVKMVEYYAVFEFYKRKDGYV